MASSCDSDSASDFKSCGDSDSNDSFPHEWSDNDSILESSSDGSYFMESSSDEEGRDEPAKESPFQCIRRKLLGQKEDSSTDTKTCRREESGAAGGARDEDEKGDNDNSNGEQGRQGPQPKYIAMTSDDVYVWDKMCAEGREQEFIKTYKPRWSYSISERIKASMLLDFERYVKPGFWARITKFVLLLLLVALWMQIYKQTEALFIPKNPNSSAGSRFWLKQIGRITAVFSTSMWVYYNLKSYHKLTRSRPIVFGGVNA